MVKIKVGDFISAFHSGYHVVTGVTRRFLNLAYNTQYEQYAWAVHDEHHPDAGAEINSIIHYKQIYTERGKPIKGKKILDCDSSFCKPAIERVDRMVQEMKETIKRLEDAKKYFKDNE